MMKCPCKDCVPPNRKVGCHSTCEDYKEWRDSKDKENNEIEGRKFIDRNLYHRIL